MHKKHRFITVLYVFMQLKYSELHIESAINTHKKYFQPIVLNLTLALTKARERMLSIGISLGP